MQDSLRERYEATKGTTKESWEDWSKAVSLHVLCLPACLRTPPHPARPGCREPGALAGTAATCSLAGYTRRPPGSIKTPLLCRPFPGPWHL